MYSDDDDDCEDSDFDYYDSDLQRGIEYEEQFDVRREKVYEDPRPFTFEENECDSPGIVRSLLDQSAKVAAKHYPYHYVERLYPHIPEPVAKKFMLWSFPRTQLDLGRNIGQPFCLNSADVFENVMQIGFQVSGCCVAGDQRFDVALYIDRCVITSASCSCPSSTMPCNHITALSYYRYMKADSIPIHLPISDSLSTLNREQLLYLVKFVLNKHSNVLLRSAQLITSELLDENSEKNAQPGAPDPTAGGDSFSEPVWLRRH